MAGIHIQLSESASEKMLKASGVLNRSVSEIVSLILENLDSMEIESTISIRVRKGNESVTASLTVDKRKKRYILDF